MSPLEPARPKLPATLRQQQSDFTAEGAPPPVLTPVTTSNRGRFFVSLHADSTPTLKAPPEPPPEIIRKSIPSALAGPQSPMLAGISSGRASK